MFSKLKTGYKLELLTLETIRLLGSTKKDVDADKNNENVSDPLEWLWNNQFVNKVGPML